MLRIQLDISEFAYAGVVKDHSDDMQEYFNIYEDLPIKKILK